MTAIILDFPPPRVPDFDKCKPHEKAAYLSVVRQDMNAKVQLADYLRDAVLMRQADNWRMSMTRAFHRADVMAYIATTQHQQGKPVKAGVAAKLLGISTSNWYQIWSERNKANVQLIKTWENAARDRT